MSIIQIIGSVVSQKPLRTPKNTPIKEITLAGIDQILGGDAQPLELPWYHTITAFDTLAELYAEVSQSDVLYVEGSLNYTTWEKAGVKHSSLDIKAQKISQLEGEFEFREDKRGQPRLVGALNDVTLIGNLTRDVELRYTPNGVAVARLSVAEHERWPVGNDTRERTHFIGVELWRDAAEAVKDFKKGERVFTHGRFVNDSWTDNDGNKRFTSRVEADLVARPLKREAAGKA